MAKGKKTLTEQFNAPFAVALRQLMEESCTTQDDLAVEVGKTRQTVSQYVNGKSEPGYETLVKIADYFDVSVDYLLGRTKDKSLAPSAIDELGISDDVVSWFKSIKDLSTDRLNLSEGTSILLGDPFFQQIIRDLRDYSEAVKAEVIYGQLCSVVCKDASGSEYTHLLTEKVTELASSNVYGETISQCLVGENYMRNLDVCENQIVADILCEGIVSGFSEIYASRVSRNFTGFLRELELNARNSQIGKLLEETYPENMEVSHGTHREDSE